MENQEDHCAYKAGQTLANIVMAICGGLIIGFALVYWKITLISALITLAVLILVRNHVRFTKL